MTESTNKTAAESKNLFENDFVYVTPDGEVVLRETEYFKERTLASVDPESVTEQIEAFETAFEHLKAKMDTFFTDIEESEELESAREKFEAFINEVSKAEAVGDFATLLDNAKEKFTAFEASMSSEQEETESEKENEVAEQEEVSQSDEKPGKDEEPSEGREGNVENYFKELAEKAGELIELTDWAYASMEFENIDHKWSEGPDPDGVDIKPYREKIDTLREQFEQKKQEHYEEQQRLRQENLEKKKELLKKLNEIVDENKWTLTKEVGKLKGRWDQIKPVPAEEAEKLDESFQKLLNVFDEHKVDRLVKKKQQEEDNLTGKLVILEKMESFVKNMDKATNWDELEKDFNKLTKQFRKIGRVAAEKNQEVWDRYHSAQDTFHSMRFKHDKSYRQQIEKFLSKKKQLIDEAESLIDADDLADAARRVNKLHRRWKKVGNLPQKDENEMWDRFKEATDAFNQKKSENIDLLRDQEESNYNEKLVLIEKAEELKESEDWEEAHRKFQSLMDQWKNIGPVPKRKSGKIWKKFKGAMDYFYDRRRDHFKEVKEERKDNLSEKEDILKKLAELKTHDDPIKAVELAKPLQEEFKKAGYVPIKHKNRMWKEYRETCDVIYDRFRATKAAVDVVGKENVGNFSADDIADIRKKQSEADKLRKQLGKLEKELLQMKESLSYFKPSGSGSGLLDEVKGKIEKAENEITQKEDKLAELEKEIDLIKREA